MPSIYVESGVEEGACYGFPPGDVVFIVGRAPNSGIVITDPLVSRQHCRIERINGRYRVVDLGSHNGVSLNDEKLPTKSTREMSFGDVVRIGESELVLREEAPDDEGELAGRRLGGYQLVKRIGSGGMGEVYRAVQVALGRPVAIKILSPELTEDSTFIDRFMTEARAAGKLNHPNVAQVHEVGEVDGIYYYSMEYINGGSVQDRVRGGGKLPVEEAVKMVLGAARALDYAEKHGVIHCDIKPDNLMLNDEGEVLITDLGIARMVKSVAEKVNQDGGVLGSPHYMAPEQARGEPIDHRVDLYSLGATFYRMVSGRTPFTGKTAREIMEKQVYEEPPGLRSLDPDIPQSVCRVIARMMKKKPDKRYATARELITDLDRLREELAPEEKRETISRRQSQLTRRARRKSGAGVFAVLAVVVLVLAAAGIFMAMSGGGGTSDFDLKRMENKATAAEGRGDLEEALNLYRKLQRQAAQGSAFATRAAAAAARLKKSIAERRAAASVEGDWKAVQGKMKRAKTAADFKRLAADYDAFAARHPQSSHTANARQHAKQYRARYAGAAESQVREFEKQATKLAAECKFGELHEGWDRLAAEFAGTPAGKLAEKRGAEVWPQAGKEFAAALDAAEKALKEGRFSDVAKPFERFAKADNAELMKKAKTAIEEFKRKAAAERERLKKEAERRKKLAACDAVRDAALKLAMDYEYPQARAKFVDAQLAYRKAGFTKQVEATRELVARYRAEPKLFDRLYDYARAGKLASALTRLADGKQASVVSVGPGGLAYSRGMGKRDRVAWKELPVRSVYDLLRRPKLTSDERVVLARFALDRKLFAEAKVQLERVLAAEPERKKELLPLLEAAEKGAAGAPKPKPKAPAKKNGKKD